MKVTPSAELTSSDQAWWTPERRQAAKAKALAYQHTMTPKQRSLRHWKTNPNYQNSNPVELIRRNMPERLCEEFFQSEGFKVSKRGWPDFLVQKGDRVLAVEVKPSIQDSLKPIQLEVMTWLASLGVECYQWSPDGMKEILV